MATSRVPNGFCLSALRSTVGSKVNESSSTLQLLTRWGGGKGVDGDAASEPLLS